MRFNLSEVISRVTAGDVSLPRRLIHASAERKYTQSCKWAVLVTAF